MGVNASFALTWGGSQWRVYVCVTARWEQEPDRSTTEGGREPLGPHARILSANPRRWDLRRFGALEPWRGFSQWETQQIEHQIGWKLGACRARVFVGAVAAVAGGPDNAGGFNRVRKSASGLEGSTTGWLPTGSTDSGPFFLLEIDWVRKLPPVSGIAKGL